MTYPAKWLNFDNADSYDQQRAQELWNSVIPMRVADAAVYAENVRERCAQDQHGFFGAMSTIVSLAYKDGIPEDEIMRCLLNLLHGVKEGIFTKHEMAPHWRELTAIAARERGMTVDEFQTGIRATLDTAQMTA
jgi:hypothetical protein